MFLRNISNKYSPIHFLVCATVGEWEGYEHETLNKLRIVWVPKASIVSKKASESYLKIIQFCDIFERKIPSRLQNCRLITEIGLQNKFRGPQSWKFFVTYSSFFLSTMRHQAEMECSFLSLHTLNTWGKLVIREVITFSSIVISTVAFLGLKTSVLHLFSMVSATSGNNLERIILCEISNKFSHIHIFCECHSRGVEVL